MVPQRISVLVQLRSSLIGAVGAFATLALAAILDLEVHVGHLRFVPLLLLLAELALGELMVDSPAPCSSSPLVVSPVALSQL